MQIHTTSQDRQVVIQIKGVFNFKGHQQFRQAYEGHAANSRFVLDFAGIEAIDSSALGMLLILREYAGGDESNITITNVPAEIGKILDVARFNELFKMG
ncbi:MAG: STAS domain-containing protein [Magnetococcales bacterium]|nr:STAS domain-containing protein [Magnetococcales bacterium]